MVQVVILRRNLPNIRTRSNICNRPTCRATGHPTNHQPSQLHQRLTIAITQTRLIEKRLTKSLHCQRGRRPTCSTRGEAAAGRLGKQTAHQSMDSGLGVRRGAHQHVADLAINHRRQLLHQFGPDLVLLLLLLYFLRIKDLIDRLISAIRIPIQAGKRFVHSLASLLLLRLGIGDSDRAIGNGAPGSAGGIAFDCLLRTPCRRGRKGVHAVLQQALTTVEASCNSRRTTAVLRLVLNIAGSQRAGGEAVLASVGRTGQHRALQVRVLLDVDLEAAIARVDAALLPDRVVGAVGVAARHTDAAADRGAVADRGHAQAGLEAG